jgi:hypothetical protein
MSIALNELEPFKVVDPRVNVKEASKYLFRQGANIATNQTITSTSSSSSKTSFSCNPPSPQHIISRLVHVQMKFSVTIKASRQEDGGTGGRIPISLVPYLPGEKAIDNIPDASGNRNFFCLRQFPIASVTRALTLNINSSTLTQEPYKFIHALGRFHLSESLRENELSSSPSQPDPYQKYNDSSDSVPNQIIDPDTTIDNGAVEGGGAYGSGYGTNRSPFRDYGETTQEISRASYTFDDITFSNAKKETTFTVTIVEPLFISPLSGGCSTKMGLTHVNTMNVDFSWDSNLSRVLSIDKVGLMSNFSVRTNPVAEVVAPDGTVVRDAVPALVANTFNLDSITVAPLQASENKIFFTYFTPQPTTKIPRSLTYDYNELKIHSKDLARYARPVTGGILREKVSTTATSDQISLMSIPNKIYIFVRPRESSRSAFTADCFAEITSLSFQFNNSSGLFSSASESDLWRMSVANGLRMSYPQWKDYTGSVLCIDFGKDIGLQPTQCVGMLGQYNMNFTLTFKILNTLKLDYELVTLVDYTGVFNIIDQQINKQIGIITPQDVLQADEYNEIDGEEMEKLHGGSFMDEMKTVYSKAKKLKPYAKKAVKAAEMLEPAISTLAPRAAPGLKKGLSIADKLLGMGYTQREINAMKASGYTNRDFQNVIAGNVVGGAHYPKSKMMQRIASYR